MSLVNVLATKQGFKLLALLKITRLRPKICRLENEIFSSAVCRFIRRFKNPTEQTSTRAWTYSRNCFYRVLNRRNKVNNIWLSAT